MRKYDDSLPTFIGKEDVYTAQRLQNGESCYLVGFGQSMTPILKSGQPTLVVPLKEDTILKKGDIVFCKVAGHYYEHKIVAVKNGKTYQIGNNHGHINGTVTRKNIYGVMAKILPVGFDIKGSIAENTKNLDVSK